MTTFTDTRTAADLRPGDTFRFAPRGTAHTVKAIRKGVTVRIDTGDGITEVPHDQPVEIVEEANT